MSLESNELLLQKITKAIQDSRYISSDTKLILRDVATKDIRFYKKLGPQLLSIAKKADHERGKIIEAYKTNILISNCMTRLGISSVLNECLRVETTTEKATNSYLSEIWEIGDILDDIFSEENDFSSSNNNNNNNNNNNTR
eukprot:408590_1